MKVKSLADWVLLEVSEYDDPKSGLIVPPHLRKKKPKGVVIDCGSLCDEEFKKGEVVLFDKSGTKKLPDCDLVLCPEFRINLKEI